MQLSTKPPPEFTVVSAVYNVARFLPDFIRSIDSQTCDPALLQIVMVDDGSTDESLEMVHEWARRRPELVDVLSKENGGQGSARNLGLTVARGEWVTFIDPDDWVNDRYFAIFDEFSTAHPDATMMCSHRIIFQEPEGEFIDNHPLKHMFRKDQLVALRKYPEYFHGSAPAAFLRRSTIETAALKFDTRIRPNFEDGHFCTKYLLLEPDPRVGFLRSAEYYYRKRGDGTSTLSNSVMEAGRFVDVPRYGYLDVLDDAIERYGNVPLWTQNMILYELSWYFSSEARMSNAASAAVGDVGARFVDLLGQIVQRLDRASIDSFSIRKYDPAWRDVMLHGVDADESWHTDYVVIDRLDSTHREVRVAYRFTGQEPAVEFLINGSPVVAPATKIRSHRYFGTDLLFERIAWLPHTGTLRVRIDGEDAELTSEWAPPKITSLWPSQLERLFHSPPPRALGQVRAAMSRSKQLVGKLRNPKRFVGSVRGKLTHIFGPPLIRKIARSGPVRKRFGSAWVLVDRLHAANDSAEILFRHLREQRPDINAWFVVEKHTEDWRRLRAEGVERVIKVDSLEWKLLMLNCTELISSHADVPVMAPPSILQYRQADWRFTFLQHGVIKDDLSNWLNNKQIDTFITSTIPEYESIVADRTPYAFTTREVQLTGLPRFDALHRAAERHPSPNVILIAPTWRHWLNEPLAVGSQRRRIVDGFSDTEFARKWHDLIHSERLRHIAETNGLTIVFIPHPNLEPAIPLFDLPEHVETATYADADLHDLYGRAFTLITDFSSAAFNTAYLRRQPIYYFFDHDLVMAGGHVGRQGYFDYRRDGFGPLVDDSDAVTDELEKLIANGGDPCEPFRSRIESVFPHRDGRCCERVTAAIEARATGYASPS